MNVPSPGIRIFRSSGQDWT